MYTKENLPYIILHKPQPVIIEDDGTIKPIVYKWFCRTAAGGGEYVNRCRYYLVGHDITEPEPKFGTKYLLSTFVPENSRATRRCRILKEKLIDLVAQLNECKITWEEAVTALEK